jgi:RNA polymerase sigma-70 factor (ECF subfamily)
MTPGTADTEDAADMARLVDGHDAALNALMERHGEKVFHYLIRQLQSEADAADLAQETFVRVYQNRARFDPSARFSTWLYTIATNLVRDRFRWRGRHPQVALEAENESTGGTLGDTLTDGNPGPDEEMQRAERSDAVRRAVARLPEDLRTAIILSEYERHSYAEIAAISGCSVKAVEGRIARARQLLRSHLAGMADFC